MDAKDLFSFDVRGFVVVRGGARAALDAAAGDEARAVLSSALLRQCVVQLVHQGASEGEVVIDTPVEWLPQVDGPGREKVLEDGSSGAERRWKTAFGSESIVRYAQGLRVVVALCDCPAGAGGLHVLPASHKSGLSHTPAEVLSGALPELWHQPALAAGDCVVMASNLVAILRPWTLTTPQRLLHCELIGPQTRPTSGIPAVGAPQPWHDQLTPLEMAVCGVQGLDSAAPIVISNGVKAWLSPPLSSWNAYLEAGGMVPDPLELYQWDLLGILHLKGVLSEDEVARALAAIDGHQRGETGKEGDVIAWENGHAQPFRTMMTHPAVLARLAWMQGPGSYNNSRSLFCWERGQGGQGVHGDVTGTGARSQYHNYDFYGDHTRTGSINVAWQLMDVDETDGGFVYMPGGHKASLPLPVEHYSETVVKEGGQERRRHAYKVGDNHDPEGMYGIVRPLAKAGDVIFFMGGATPHGSVPYSTDANHPRRAVLMNWLGHGINLRGAQQLPRL